MAVKRWNGTAWEIYAGSDLAPVKVTDGRVGKTTFIGATTPTNMVDGDIWIDQDTTTNAVVPTALLAKGDIFVATASGTYTRLAAGNNGESLYADSTTSTGLRWQSDYNVGKNKIINGDFSIWQRGTSFTLSTGVSTFGPDRWHWIMPGGTVVSRQAFTAGSAPVTGYEGQYYVNTTINTNGQYYEANQKVEDARTFAGQTVTLSFWARSTVGAQSMNTLMSQNFGTGGSPSSAAFASLVTSSTGAATYTPTSTWTRYWFTYSLPSVSGKTFGTNNDSFLLVRPLQFLSTNTNTSIDIWGVQLEAGSVATPFTTNTGNPQAELAACQRYYYRLNASQGSSYAVLGTGFATNTTTGAIVINFPVTLRVKPSAIESGGSIRIHDESNAYTVSSYTYDANTASTDNIRILVNSSGLTAYRPLFLGGNNSTAAYLAFSAEL